jgi:hypothetical protein
MATRFPNPHIEAANRLRRRDNRLDAFRGLCLVIMTVDHLPSILEKFTYQLIGYVTAATGFVFLSGVVTGLVYTDVSLQQTDAILRRRAFLRARTIYSYNICSFVALLLIGKMLELNNGYWESWTPLFQQHFAVAILKGVTFVYQPQLLDILPLYCVFIMIAPFIITQFKKGKVMLVFGLSISLWTSAQFGIPDHVITFLQPYVSMRLGGFDIFAWQIIFVGGLYGGFTRYMRGEQEQTYSKALLIYFLFVSIALFLSRHHLLLHGPITEVVGSMTDARTLGILRVLNFAAVCYIIACGFNRLKLTRPINCLAYLGRNSLQVFTFHIPLVYFMRPILSQGTNLSELSKGMIVILCVGSLYLPALAFEHLNRRNMRPC